MKKSEKLYNPFLVGDSVYLRGLEENDLRCNYFQWFNEQSTDLYTHHALYPNSIEKMKTFYNKAINHENMIVLAVIHKNDNCHIGNVCLQNIEWVNRRAEFALIFGEKKYFGKGLATEAGKLIIDYGFDRFNLNSIWLGVHAKNIAAIKVYKKLGFIEEGHIRERFIRNNKTSDQILMSILRKEWEKSDKAK